MKNDCTTKPLAALIAQQARVKALCVLCGRVGDIYVDDHTTLLCAQCWLRQAEANDE